MQTYIFYNSVTGEIFYKQKYRNDKMAQANCNNNKSFNMVFKPETDLPGILHIDEYKVNVSATPHSVESTTAKQITTDVPQQIKTQRNMKLTSSDWTQAVDSPLSDAKKAEWQTYRQALRDIDYANATTLQYTWPNIPD